MLMLDGLCTEQPLIYIFFSFFMYDFIMAVFSACEKDNHRQCDGLLLESRMKIKRKPGKKRTQMLDDVLEKPEL